MSDVDRITADRATEIVQTAKREDLAISVRNVGGNPHFRHTPYRNHRGVLCDLWSIVNLSFKPMPGRTLLTRPEVIWPDESEYDYEVNYPTTEWVWARIHGRLVGRVELIDPEDSPTRIMGGWDRRQQTDQDDE